RDHTPVPADRAGSGRPHPLVRERGWFRPFQRAVGRPIAPARPSPAAPPDGGSARRSRPVVRAPPDGVASPSLACIPRGVGAPRPGLETRAGALGRDPGVVAWPPEGARPSATGSTFRGQLEAPLISLSAQVG